MKRIPFDLELAKAITAGEKEGRVVTNLGLPARIVCRDSKEYPFICSSIHYHYCIPYNEQTKHLLGTTEDCEE